jgi:positive phototaxis protein PixI
MVSPSYSTDTANERQEFLKFHLLPETTVLVPINQLIEVITVPFNQVIPIPELPSWVMGVYNWRGKILWLIDTGDLVGLGAKSEALSLNNTYNVVVLKSEDTATTTTGNDFSYKTLGLVVDRVEEIEWCYSSDIQTPPSTGVNPGFLPFLQGYLIKPAGDIMVIFDGESIMSTMPQSDGP